MNHKPCLMIKDKVICCLLKYPSLSMQSSITKLIGISLNSSGHPPTIAEIGTDLVSGILSLLLSKIVLISDKNLNLGLPFSCSSQRKNNSQLHLSI